MFAVMDAIVPAENVRPAEAVRFTAARFALGYRTPSAFAEALGASPSHVSHWETGRHVPNRSYLAMLFQMGVGADWIFHGSWRALHPRLRTFLVSLEHDTTVPPVVRTVAREVREAISYCAAKRLAEKGFGVAPPVPSLRFVALEDEVEGF